MSFRISQQAMFDDRRVSLYGGNGIYYWAVKR